MLQAFNLTVLRAALISYAFAGLLTSEVGLALLATLPGTITGAWLGSSFTHMDGSTIANSARSFDHSGHFRYLGQRSDLAKLVGQQRPFNVSSGAKPEDGQARLSFRFALESRP